MKQLFVTEAPKWHKCSLIRMQHCSLKDKGRLPRNQEFKAFRAEHKPYPWKMRNNSEQSAPKSEFGSPCSYKIIYFICTRGLGRHEVEKFRSKVVSSVRKYGAVLVEWKVFRPMNPCGGPCMKTFDSCFPTDDQRIWLFLRTQMSPHCCYYYIVRYHIRKLLTYK
jgi:hypothetical protein